MTALARMLALFGTAADFTSGNPVLRLGEMGVETDTGKMKVGNGVTAWTSLAYVNGGTNQTITLTGDVTGSGTGSFATTLATAQPAVHTWALAQTFTVAPVFTNQSGTRTALGLGTAATQNTGTSGANLPFANGNNTWGGTNGFQAVTVTSIVSSGVLHSTSAGGITTRMFSSDGDTAGYIGTTTAHDFKLLCRGAFGFSMDANGSTFLLAESHTSILSPAQIVANTDNYAPTGHATTRIFRLSTDASRNITGLAGGTTGRRITISNVGAQNLVFSHDVTSTAGNRFLCPGSAAFTLNANDTIELWYDGTSARWRLIAF